MRATTDRILHITSGDRAGGRLAQSGLPGEVFVWHDILYDGPRQPGWPDDETLRDRALFLERETGGGLNRADIRDTLRAQYRKLAAAGDFERVVLWFDACLFDQAMLVHVLTGLRFQGAQRVDLLVVDAFPGIVPFDGLGQMRPHELASVFNRRRELTEGQYRYAERADTAFALQDGNALAELAAGANAPLPWVPAAAERWLLEQPDPKTGLGRLESLALEAVRSGLEKPTDILAAVTAADSHPRFWGDTTLWARINGLADREPPLVKIVGPKNRLPQWGDPSVLSPFRVFPVR
jgi:hypothetical protein